MNESQIQNTSQEKIEKARARIENVRQSLYRIIIGHDNMIDAAIYALIGREHMVMIGPPGTAKTMLVMSLSKLLQARHYMYLMTRFTTFDELFGPIDVLTLTKGELKRKWSRIIEAHIIFLDEVFKASATILNTLLSIMQERVVYDPFTGEAITTNVWSVFAASNEHPQEEELAAVYDRFTLKVHVDMVNNMDLLRKALETRWGNPAKLEPIASMEDISTLHDCATSLLRGDALKLYEIHMMPMVQALRSNGVFVSDRMVIEKLPKLFAAYLAIHGVSDSVAAEAAVKLVRYVAHSREELAIIDKIITEMMGEVATLYKRLEEGKKLLEMGELRSALNVLREVALFDVEKLQNKPWLADRAKSIITEAQRYVAMIQDILNKLKL
jgi:MoxR-like ATPase